MKKFMILLMLLSLTTSVEAKQHIKKVKSNHQQISEKKEILTNKQKEILKVALNTAKKDGLRNPKILPGIIMHESKAGNAKNFRTSRHKPSYDQTVGLGQIKASTAKSVLEENPDLKAKMKSSNIKSELANNDLFNIAIASRYLKYLSKHSKSDSHLIAAYNLGNSYGIKNPDKLPYVRSVRHEMIFLSNFL